jgi:hypothetical protein
VNHRIPSTNCSDAIRIVQDEIFSFRPRFLIDFCSPLPAQAVGGERALTLRLHWLTFAYLLSSDALQHGFVHWQKRYTNEGVFRGGPGL